MPGSADPIRKTDIPGLITALRLDFSFKSEAKKCEKKFKSECELLGNYEDTEFLRGCVVKERKSSDGKKTEVRTGGLGTAAETNAMTVIVRYFLADKSPRYNAGVLTEIVEALEDLCVELATYNYGKGDDEKTKARAAGLRLINRIYKKCPLDTKKNEIFERDYISDWLEAWHRDKID